jgi:hypothetical protein
MVDTLGRYLNKALLVSIPSIFGDDSPHTCALAGIESSGLWLESEELWKKLSQREDIRAPLHQQAASTAMPSTRSKHERSKNSEGEIVFKGGMFNGLAALARKTGG